MLKVKWTKNFSFFFSPTLVHSVEWGPNKHILKFETNSTWHRRDTGSWKSQLFGLHNRRAIGKLSETNSDVTIDHLKPVTVWILKFFVSYHNTVSSIWLFSIWKQWKSYTQARTLSIRQKRGHWERGWLANSDVIILTNPTTWKARPFQKHFRDAFGNLRTFSYVTSFNTGSGRKICELFCFIVVSFNV